MNNATYRRYPSPFQPKAYPVKEMLRKASDINDKENPVRSIIEKCIGSHTLTATVEEDMSTIAALKREGLVAFLCTLTKEGVVISQGRGSAILNPNNNRYLSRAIHGAFNSAVSDSVIRATRVLDTLRNPEEITARGTTERDNVFESATAKQKQYLLQLASTNLDEADREQYAASVDDMTKEEASRAIREFAK